MAYDLASNDLLDLDLDTQIQIHLTSNHYPPVPSSMVAPCIEKLTNGIKIKSVRQLTLLVSQIIRLG